MAIASRSSDATLTADNILKMVNPLDVFNRYSGVSIPIGNAISSPLREDDSSPSFCIWQGDDTLMFSDFGMNKHGNCIMFVQLLYDISFKDALIMIDSDFNLGLYKSTNVKHVKVPKKTTYQKPEKKKTKFVLKVQDFTADDLAFWKRFGIDEYVLNYYNVVSLKSFYVNDNYIKADKLAFAYLMENNTQVKIYQPRSKKLKFLSNTNTSTIQGIDQLPYTSNNIVITSSMKDVMVLYTMGIHAIALSSEMQMPDKELIDMLKRRFLNISLLYDNDYNKTNNWGQIQAKKIINTFTSIKQNLKIPAKYKSKDPSDLVANVGYDTAYTIIHSELICTHKNDF